MYFKFLARCFVWWQRYIRHGSANLQSKEAWYWTYEKNKVWYKIISVFLLYLHVDTWNKFIHIEFVFRNELPEYDDIELTRGIGSIDLTDDSYHVPMKSWGMSVSATNINCIDGILRSKY